MNRKVFQEKETEKFILHAYLNLLVKENKVLTISPPFCYILKIHPLILRCHIFI